MSLLTGNNLSKLFGPEEVFSGVNVDIPHKARIALVGPNGAGKTTLLQILIGEDLPNSGAVSVARGTRIGFLPQRPELVGGHTLWEEALTAFAELRATEAELTRLEHAIADPAQHDAALATYGPLQEKFELAGGYSYEIRTRMVLQGIGFAPEDDHMPLEKLSGGQRTRALLARLLLESPDLLVLDEPTNHLDINAIEWLENYLDDFPGAVLVVSHDRYFMDAVASTVWELNFGTLETYRGNFSHYVDQREARHERLLKEFESQQEMIAKEEEYIRRNLAGQNTKQAQGRRTRLDRFKRDSLIKRPGTRNDFRMNIASTGRSGDRVLATKNLLVGYADAPAPLFAAPDILLMRGEVAALIGPNGAGKSTFLKTILGQLAPLAGEAKLGASVEVGYFAQAHELLDPSHSILDEIMSVKASMTPAQARTYLGSFLFTGDDVFRPIGTLSGGERGRVALAKLALAGANFLMLDEPTNHLDITSQEILQTVLAGFDGTILLVSHDRYLVDALATQIWAVSPGKLTVYKGTYKEYVAARDRDAQPTSAPEKIASSANGAKNAVQPARKNGLNAFQLQKKVAALEAAIETLENQLEDLNGALATASSQGDSGKVAELGAAYIRAEAELHTTMEEWAILAD